MTIIKATDHNAAIHATAFNFDDMAVRARQYLDQVRAEAVEIVIKAREEADAVRARAEAEGLKAGREVVEQMVGKQVLPALRKVTQDIQYAKQAWLTQWEKSAVHVAAAIAGRVIRRELPNMPDVPLALVREALELAAGSPQLKIHLNPSDHEKLGKEVELIVKELSGLASTELVADPEITPGGCRIDTRFGVIDQQFEAQLARIEEELT